LIRRRLLVVGLLLGKLAVGLLPMPLQAANAYGNAPPARSAPCPQHGSMTDAMATDMQMGTDMGMGTGMDRSVAGGTGEAARPGAGQPAPHAPCCKSGNCPCLQLPALALSVPQTATLLRLLQPIWLPAPHAAIAAANNFFRPPI